MGNGGRDRGVQSIMAQELFGRSKLADGLLLGLVLNQLLLLLLAGSEFGLTFHDWTSSRFLKVTGEGFAGPMEFSPNGVSRLFGELADLFVA
jgi:hypothetical protein